MKYVLRVPQLSLLGARCEVLDSLGHVTFLAKRTWQRLKPRIVLSARDGAEFMVITVDRIMDWDARHAVWDGRGQCLGMIRRRSQQDRWSEHGQWWTLLDAAGAAIGEVAPASSGWLARLIESRYRVAFFRSATASIRQRRILPTEYDVEGEELSDRQEALVLASALLLAMTSWTLSSRPG